MWEDFLFDQDAGEQDSEECWISTQSRFVVVFLLNLSGRRVVSLQGGVERCRDESLQRHTIQQCIPWLWNEDESEIPRLSKSASVCQRFTQRALAAQLCLHSFCFSTLVSFTPFPVLNNWNLHLGVTRQKEFFLNNNVKKVIYKTAAAIHIGPQRSKKACRSCLPMGLLPHWSACFVCMNASPCCLLNKCAMTPTKPAACSWLQMCL